MSCCIIGSFVDDVQVANEIVAEFTESNNSAVSLDKVLFNPRNLLSVYEFIMQAR